MGFLKALTRTAGLGLCAVAFTGSALADPGNGNGNGNGGTPPGQEKKAEQAAPAPAPAAAQPPAEQKAAAVEAKKAEKQEAKAAPAAKSDKAQKAQKAEKSGKAGHSSGSYKETSLGDDKKKGMDHKHTICHATGSSSNPYVVITPSVSGVFHGHMDHQGDEDIVPPFMYKGTWYSQNWDAEGQATFNNGCAAPAPAIAPQQTAAPQQTQTDVCPNLDGMQTEVPAGMVKDESGNCVHKPARVDVCPNLAGMQAKVPAGMVKDANGHCVAAPASAVTPGGKSDKGGKAGKGAKAAPAGEVLGASAPAATDDEPASGVLGAVASAPDSIAQTATSGTLPFTGIPLWIAALLGGGLLATGLALRRAAQH